jgi:redox-sensitive bicupin YhaK (pirin superfamily)
MPWPANFNALGYVLAGAGTVGAEQRPVESGQLVVFGKGDTLTFTGNPSRPLDVLVLGGRPIGEPVATYGPFVMNTKAELLKAFEDYQAGRLGTVPADGLRPYRQPRA